MADPTPPTQAPTVRVVAMPADSNPNGDIFGGWLMSQMDLAAGSVASRHSTGRAVTIAVEGMKFHLPVSIGDEVSVYTKLASVGRTSMTIEVEAWRRHRDEHEMCKVTQASFTFVAIDLDGRPRPVPPLPAEGIPAC